MNNQNKKSNLKTENDGLDLIASAKTLWGGRKIIIKVIFVFMILGFFTAVFSPKEYTVSTTMLPTNDSKKSGGNLSNLASLAGINLGSIGNDTGISPTLYPLIVNSIPFQKELLLTPLTIKGQDSSVSYSKYYTTVYRPGLLGLLRKYTIGLPGMILKKIKSPSVIDNNTSDPNSLLSISDEENRLIKKLKNQLLLEVNEKDGFISISVTMPEAIASAELTKKTQELLQEYIINFKARKSKEQLTFIKERYEEKEREFKTIQNQLARLKDENQNVTTSIAQSKIENLQSQHDLTFSVYSELAKQLETQQIKVKEETPVFTILKPVSIPIEKSKPNRLLIFIVWVFMGCVIGVFTVFVKKFMKSLRKIWNQK